MLQPHSYHIQNIRNVTVTTHPPKPRTSSINPPNPQKTPNAPPNFRPCPAPILANPDASPANSDGPLANFGACPAATDTYPGPPKPREPPPLFPIFATHHQLNTLVPPTHSGVSRQPQGNPHSPMIPSMYQHGTILNHNRHPPTLSSPAKPHRHSRRTPKSSGISQSYLSLPVLSQSPSLVLSPFHYHSCYRFVSLFESTLVPYQPHPISSDAISVTPSDHCAQALVNPNDLTNSAIMITNPDTPSPGPNLALRSGSVPIDHTAAYPFASANLPYGLLPEPCQDRLVSSQSNFSGPPQVHPDHTPPTIRTSHQCPKHLRVFGYQCKGITPA
ncbi:hypothetical protein E4T56_gene12769 [Termitomyces sp. T112]|nr:hypothetical protein E4T56_gene12769 [Termitomyces sp. T112]